jgi:histidine triad (HIT) family protein
VNPSRRRYEDSSASAQQRGFSATKRETASTKNPATAAAERRLKSAGIYAKHYWVRRRKSSALTFVNLTFWPNPAMEDCIFCKMIAGDIPVSKVLENHAVLAFADINPATPGHTLVIPKTHSVNILDISAVDGAAVMEAARCIARVMPDCLGCKGVNLFHCAEEVAWQSVFHFHIHVIPRYETLELTQAWTITPGNLEEIAKKAKAIANALGDSA